MIRRLTAVVVLGALWATAWAILGLLVGLYQYYRAPGLAIFDAPSWASASPVLAVTILFARSWGMGGGISGVLFGIVLMLAERDRTVATLRMSRVALWGALGSVLVPIALIVPRLVRLGIQWRLLATYGAIIGLAGALSAVATLWIARRGPPQPAPKAAA